MNKLFEAIGGRKFALCLLFVVGLTVLGLAGYKLDAELLDTIETLFLAFVGGNAVTKLGLSNLFKGKGAQESQPAPEPTEPAEG